MGIRLTMKWGLLMQPSFSSNSSSWPFSFSFKSNEGFYDSKRTCCHSAFHEDKLCHLGDPVRAQKSSSALQVLEHNFLDIDGVEFHVSRWSGLTPHDMSHNNTGSVRGDNMEHLTSFQDTKALYFKLLMKNLHVLEEIIADSEVVQLERDILMQLERLGALEFFQSCLSRTESPGISYNLSQAAIDPAIEPETEPKHALDGLLNKVFIQSVKKGGRKKRRKRCLEKEGEELGRRSRTYMEDSQQPLPFPGNMHLNSTNKRRNIARNEAELSRGVKLVAELERIKTSVEKEIGKTICTRRWAEAAQIDTKVLLQRTRFGWYCRDELLRSARPLILYIIKNYRGLGVAFEDLLQAGNCGVLQGAERFDHTRGYKFSTYVQFWIRKSISKLVAQHARGIKIPPSMCKAINQVQKARKALSNAHSNCSDLNEIAKLTGLSTAKIISASTCLKVVGSLDQKVGESISTKLLEMSPDVSIRSPEAIVGRKHMADELYTLLEGLEARERQVLILRYGLKSHQPKSLEEIGGLFSVSKEWVRKIEKMALAKLQKHGTFLNLSHFLYM